MQKYIQLASILLIGLTATRADKDDQAGEGCRQHKLRLYGTKTLYEEARRTLKRLDDDDLPKSFDDDSLEHEHKDLLKDGCAPVALYFLGRHSARFPDSEDIEQYNRDLLELVGRMKVSDNQAGCRAHRRDFLEWTPKMQPKQDNLITELGGREERNIARRLKRLYPDLFDARKTDIKIGVTEKLRTAQTGSEFLKEVDGLSLDPACRETPTNDPSRPEYSVDKVLAAPCYKYLASNHRATFLDFRKQCDKMSGAADTKDPLTRRVKDPALKQRMARRVAQKLGLDSEALTVDQLKSVWDTCKYENAARNESIWCSLFDKKDVEMLEYIEDVDSYLEDAYGSRANPRQSCPVVGNLVESFQALIREYEQGRGSNSPRRAYFYFCHSDLIHKLLATFGMFRDDESFAPRRVADFESEGKVPKKRHWRSSLVSPFSANFAFILYRCPSSKCDKFKVLTAVNEQAVKLSGCKDSDCKFQDFLRAYGDMRDCDLQKICRRV